MLTSFGKILRKIRIDRFERLLDMADKLGISVAFLSSVEIGKKSIPVGMEDKIIELYDLDRDMASLLRKEADICRKNFTIKPSDSFGREAMSMFVKTLENFSQQDSAEFKKLLEKVGKKGSAL
ncbi:helix-turn-helix transcriptional regulator [Bartonella kosoyi]|uniref:Helix-turn-helix transcriptional regulator n=1 Tax=Bartonella kosoyi TaxID=2133959 RepID=A0A5B9CY88_9HYPH|nr:helix-turn-helix transcriptional regulator [Bartonella kosoyi]QEE09265.1 helix-turn-helix transcriptional regulator [Bartonella kosoyi]